jgi:hypothetical protein
LTVGIIKTAVFAFATESRSVVELTELEDGLIVASAAIDLACELERRGARLLAENGELIVDCPINLLTAMDGARIRRWRYHLLAIAAYAV